MDEVTYKAWWPLHLRAVSGEVLSNEERAFYEAKLTQLHQEETLQDNVSNLREARAEIQRLAAERLQLQGRRQELQSKMAALEAALSEPTQQLLGVRE